MDPGKRRMQDMCPTLYSKLLDDSATLTGIDHKSRAFRMDKDHLLARIRTEGISICTTLLPGIGKAYDSAMETGIYVAPRHAGDLLKGLLSLSLDGDRWGAPVPAVVKVTRQVLYTAYKLELPYSEEQRDKVLTSFIRTEEEISDADSEGPLSALQATADLIGIASTLVSDLFGSFDPRDIRPRHGPGAVATGERLDDKWRFKRLYHSVHQHYPFYEYFMGRSRQFLLDQVRSYRELHKLEYPTAKVVLVPKDSRGPRLISEEPLELQYLQQGLGRAMVQWIERNGLTAGHVNFRNQGVNQNVARESSQHHYYGTLDLKDASDRVSCRLVSALFPKGMVPYLMALRSHATILPDGREVALRKYAPMGSALCFPVEAICFWAICVASLMQEGLTRTAALNDVYVYGDDLIVPTSYVDTVCRNLSLVGLRVNVDKSYSHGDFRESCGVDAYQGVEVQPVRLRTVWSSSPTDGRCYESWIAYRNGFYTREMKHTATYLEEMLENTYGAIPRWYHDADFPCFVDENPFLPFKARWNSEKSCQEVHARVIRSRRAETRLDGYPRLMRSLTGNTPDEPTVVVLAQSSKIVRKWSRLQSA